MFRHHQPAWKRTPFLRVLRGQGEHNRRELQQAGVDAQLLFTFTVETRYPLLCTFLMSCRQSPYSFFCTSFSCFLLAPRFFFFFLHVRRFARACPVLEKFPGPTKEKKTVTISMPLGSLEDSRVFKIEKYYLSVSLPCACCRCLRCCGVLFVCVDTLCRVVSS